MLLGKSTPGTGTAGACFGHNSGRRQENVRNGKTVLAFAGTQSQIREALLLPQ